MAVSIQDVAARAGVSVGTVSHVLNNNIAARIAVSTQERVRQAAQDLGYRPNRVARSLGRKKNDTLGLLLGGLRNPFFVEILETVETRAREMGFGIYLEAAPSLHGTFAGYGSVPDRWPVDGILMWSGMGHSLADVMGPSYATMPVVYLGAGRADGSDWAAFDYEQGGRLAATRLIARGCKRLAYLTPYAYGIDRHDEPRHVGFAAVCAENNVSQTMITTREEETRAAGLEAGLKIATLPLSERPDGIFCHNDMLAIGVYCGLRRAGVRVPEEIALVGYDGIEEGLYLDVPLTTVELPVATLCRRSLDLLLHRIKHPEEAFQNVLLPPILRDGGTA